MSKVRKLFGEMQMSWKKVIIFAVITGVYTGLINMVPVLKDTSFRDIAISFECWILFGTIVAVNCQKPVEAGLKTFVFFLISQPLVYLVEMPFLGASVWGYYKYWLIITILTLPGGMIAQLARKKNLLGTLITTVALVMISAMLEAYVEAVYCSFPHHILTLLFCVIEIIIMMISMIPSIKHRILSSIIVIAAFLTLGAVNLNVRSQVTISLPEGTGWDCVLLGDDNSTVTNDDTTLYFEYNKILVKENVIICKNAQNGTAQYTVEIGENRSVNLVPDK